MKIPLIEIKNVGKTYRSKGRPVQALRSISLTIYPGEIIGLLGTNGAGKTTLSSLIASLHPVSSGDILFKGKSIYSHVADYRMHIGFCPQKPNFESTLTVRENLLFAGRYFQVPAAELHERVAYLLHEFGLECYADDNPEILSGGYKQRLLIARALVHQPDMVILDEPTVALDPHVRRQLWEVIKQLKQKRVTVLLTTHYLDEAEYLSDRVFFLDKGQILVEDTPAGLNATYNKSCLEDVFIELMYTKESV